MYVYFVRASAPPPSVISWVKIGMSYDIDARLKDLQSACPIALELIGSIRCRTNVDSRRLESKLHETIGWERVHGEWFVAPQNVTEQVQAIILREERTCEFTTIRGVRWRYG